MSASCTHVTQECPVSATLYGYRPILSVNAFFCALFGVLLMAQLAIGIWKRTWAFMIWVSIGCFGEFLGYVGRLILNRNPWNEAGLEIEICCLILAPSFIAAGIYLVLKHTAIHSGRQYSRMRPERYPWVFVGCDLCSIAVQAIGGGISSAAGAGASKSLLNIGDDLIIAGIAVQILAMTIFLALAVDFYVTKSKAQKGAPQHLEASEAEKRLDSPSPERDTSESDTTPRMRIFYYAVSFAFIMILIRCIWRIHEMAGGWGNPNMRDEPTFLILDGMMIGFAAVAMTVAHPGFLFPPMQHQRVGRIPA